MGMPVVTVTPVMAFKVGERGSRQLGIVSVGPRGCLAKKSPRPYQKSISFMKTFRRIENKANIRLSTVSYFSVSWSRSSAIRAFRYVQPSWLQIYRGDGRRGYSGERREVKKIEFLPTAKPSPAP